MNKLLKFADVRQRTQRSRSSIYEDMAAGSFPKPIKIGSRAVAWIETDIDDWITERIAERETV